MIGGEQGAEGLAFDKRGLRRVVHDVVRVLAADGLAEVQHDRLGHDQPAAEIEVLPHTLGVEAQPAQHLDEPAEHVAGRDAGARLGGIHHDAGGAVGLVLGLHRLQRDGHAGAHFGGRGDDVLAQFRVALLRHRRAADRAGRHRLLDLAELGLHQRVDLAADLGAGRGEHAEEADVLGEVVAERAGRDRHRRHAEMPAHAGLHRRSLLPERGEGARAAAEHRDKDAGRRLPEALDMADHFVDPDRRLVAEGCGHGVLAVRAAGDRHVGAALGEIGRREQRIGDQFQENVMRLAQDQQVAGLRDVLRRCAPMHPAAMRLADDPRQLPHQRHDRMAGAGETLIDALAVEAAELCGAGDRLGGFLGDDAELGLGTGQRDLDIEPGLPAVLLLVEGADAGIGNPRGGRQFVAHAVVLSPRPPARSSACRRPMSCGACHGSRCGRRSGGRDASLGGCPT